MEGVEELYKQFGVLADAKDKASEHEGAYLLILAAVKGSQGEKRLAGSFLARFFSHFPKLHENAIDAMLDLCEDEDSLTRRHAIKLLPDLCKDNHENVPRLADVLTQLLQTEDTTELSLVRSALVSLFKMEPKGTIGGLFSQILSGEEVAREKAIKFLSGAVADFGKSVLHKSPETESYLVEEIKKAMADVTGEEFQVFMTILSSLKCMSNSHQELADIVTEQAELDHPFQPSDADMVDRFIACTRQATPFFARGASPEAFFNYVVEQVLPKLGELTRTEDAGDVRLEILKLFAEMSPNELSEKAVTSSIGLVYNLLLEYMPLPPTDEGEKESDDSGPKLQFSYVECLIFAFHQLARRNPEFLTSAEAADKLKDFRLRLQYFARGCQIYIKQLRLSLQGKTGATLQQEDNKIKVVALRTTSNINAVIKDLFHNPPSFKCSVTLSWKSPSEAKPPAAKEEEAAASPLDEKRKRAGITPIKFDLPPAKKATPQHPKSPRGARRGFAQVYMPPGRRTGASNGSVQGQSMVESNRGRGQRRRGWRGGRARGRF